MVNPIPKFAKNVWSKWNIRGVVLVSLSLQIVLIFLAPFRKRSRKSILVFLLWSTYLIADYTANFCVGLISNKYGDEDTPIATVNDFVLAFWTPFLLLHLGGPDTITAFALEDNELWLRHMLGLIVQVCLTAYVFLLTLPHNTLWLPTTLVFMAGIMKFAERTRSLQLASVGNFRQSMVRKPDPGPNYAKLMEELKSRVEAGLPTKIEKMPEIEDFDFEDWDSKPATEETKNDTGADQSTNGNAAKPEDENDHADGHPPDIVENNVTGHGQGAIPHDDKKDHYKEELSNVQVVKEAYHFFKIFKGLVVDLILSFHERTDSRSYFLKLTALDNLRVIEVELNFIYQAFYTKASVICNKVGFFFRFLSVASVLAALVIFIFDPKHGFHKFDVRVTYTLLYGAVALDVVSLLMLMLSDHAFASFPSLWPQKDDADSDEPTGTSKDSSAFGFLKRVTLSGFLELKRPLWTEEKKIKSPAWLKGRSYKILCRRLLFRRWSETISGYNLISYCLQKKKRYYLDKAIDYIGIKEVIEQWKYETKQPLLQKLWVFIFTELERKSGDADDVETIQRICSSRGEWVLQEGELKREDLNKLMPYVERNTVTFDQCILLWHIATDLLFYEEEEIRQGQNENKHAANNDKAKDGNDVPETNPDIEKGSDHIAQNNIPSVKNGSDAGFVSPDDPEVEELRDFSKLLSDYLLYLIIMQPNMMSAVRGIAQIRFQDTCEEAGNFFQKREVVLALEEIAKEKSKRRTEKYSFNKLLESIKKFCKKGAEQTENEAEQPKSSEIVLRAATEEQKACKKLQEVSVEHDPSAVKGDRSKSLLFDACKLASVIKELNLEENKWKTIAQVWVELLSFAACNCIPITHVQQLSKGGEFLSLVWLSMTHLGLARQFQIKEGHARAKLIVGEDDQI